MDDLLERLAMTLCRAEHDGPEHCDEPALRHWRLPARLALAEIERTHVVVERECWEWTDKASWDPSWAANHKCPRPDGI